MTELTYFLCFCNPDGFVHKCDPFARERHISSANPMTKVPIECKTIYIPLASMMTENITRALGYFRGFRHGDRRTLDRFSTTLRRDVVVIISR
jgi:hypothetical protein